MLISRIRRKAAKGRKAPETWCFRGVNFTNYIKDVSRNNTGHLRFAFGQTPFWPVRACCSRNAPQASGRNSGKMCSGQAIREHCLCRHCAIRHPCRFAAGIFESFQRVDGIDHFAGPVKAGNMPAAFLAPDRSLMKSGDFGEFFRIVIHAWYQQGCYFNPPAKFLAAKRLS